MDLEVTPPKAEDLQLLSHSELRKVAVKYGIKRRYKSEKLIDLILSQNTECEEEVFSTPAAKELNSSRKNKEKTFDEMQMTPLATPRRGTYSLESPSSVKKDEDISSLALNASVLDMSNVTVGRGSERKLRPRKVSFVTPAVTPHRTPRRQSVRNRPKTPVASRTPLEDGKAVLTSFTTTPRVTLVRLDEDSLLESSVMAEMHPCSSTPAIDVASSSGNPDSTLKKVASSDNLKPAESTPTVATSAKSPGASRSFCKEPISAKRGITPSATRSSCKQPTSAKRGMTPNFKRIHQQAFEKMESIDDYQRRKLMNSAKKLGQPVRDLKSYINKAAKIKKGSGCSGIPFIPSASHKIKAEKFLTAKENTPQNKATKNVTPALSVGKSRLLSKVKTSSATKKFDLKASLSRKLGYKPYRGPLKPLGESANTHSTSFHAAPAKEKPVDNKVVNENRAQTRSVIRGVRTNKRFELQMRIRKLD